MIEKVQVYLQTSSKSSNICKKQIQDVEMKVYLLTYKNEKREQDRLIKQKKKSRVSNPQPSAWWVNPLPTELWGLFQCHPKTNYILLLKQLQFSTAKNKHNSIMCNMEGQRVQYCSKRIISILFLYFSICLFRFVLTSQFYRDPENTFQSIMYND